MTPRTRGRRIQTLGKTDRPRANPGAIFAFGVLWRLLLTQKDGSRASWAAGDSLIQLPSPRVIQWWLQPGQYGDYDGDGIPGERYLEYDIEGAKALLAEAGYGPGDIQGVFLSSNDLGATWFAEAEYIVEAWRNIGIDMGIVIRDGAARGSAFREGDFDYGYGFPGFGFEPVDWFGSAFHSEINKQNQPVSGLVDLELDKKIDSMNAELDPLKRFEKVAEIQRYLQEKQYYAFGANWIQIQATACWLRNHQWHYTHQNGLGLAKSWIDKSACN